ncbi:hypothetical protein BJX62DRAFT_243597 [Aspergillus germanicus]
MDSMHQGNSPYSPIDAEGTFSFANHEAQSNSYELDEQERSLLRPTTSTLPSSLCVESVVDSVPDSHRRYTLQDPDPFSFGTRQLRPPSWAEQTPTKDAGRLSSLRRYGTRKINLVKGTVLSIDYPVPSAIQNAIQPAYRDYEEGFVEEFTHLRCKYPCLSAHPNRLRGGGIVLIALASTYGIYILASILYLDPWHILTSSWAYFLGMTTSINILMVYAFCNWHDVSWGTKGSDKYDALPSATVQKDNTSKSNFIEEIDKPQADIDSQFESTVKRALAPWVEQRDGGNNKRTADDSYRNFRTGLVCLWVFSNLLLALLITATGADRMCLSNTSTTRTSWFFQVILWITAGLSLFRSIGSKGEDAYV